MRGVVMVVAGTALVYASRLAWAYLVEFVRNGRRRFVAQHVFWLTAGLMVNAGLAVGTEVDLTGGNDGLIWKEWMRLWAHLFIVIGLVPLWREHRRREDRKEGRDPAHA